MVLEQYFTSLVQMARSHAHGYVLGCKTDKK